MTAKSRRKKLSELEQILIDAKKKGVIVGYTIYFPEGVMSDFLLEWAKEKEKGKEVRS